MASFLRAAQTGNRRESVRQKLRSNNVVLGLARPVNGHFSHTTQLSNRSVRSRVCSRYARECSGFRGLNRDESVPPPFGGRPSPGDAARFFATCDAAWSVIQLERFSKRPNIPLGTTLAPRPVQSLSGLGKGAFPSKRAPNISTSTLGPHLKKHIVGRCLFFREIHAFAER